MANYQLYQIDTTTVVAIPQPDGATWGYPQRGVFANGERRVAGEAVISWRYKRAISAADFQKFSQHATAGGIAYVKTWKKPIGAVGATYTKCKAILDSLVGVEHEGEYYGVTVTWSQVEEV